MSPLAPTPMQRQEWAEGWFETASCAPHPSLQPWVHGEYCAWSECTTRRITRVETASTIVPLIITFGSRYEILDAAGASHSHGSFVAGLYDRWVGVTGETRSCAMQVNFTPFGAKLLLGVSMRDLHARTVDIHDALGHDGHQLVQHLGNSDSWLERFERLDAFLRARLAHAMRARDARVPRVMQHAWHRLVQSGGAVRIGDLASDTGWSAKRLIDGFREYTGLPPKAVARIVRFERTVEHIARHTDVAWTHRALQNGFCDQSHLIRDFVDFAGCTPTEYLRRRLPPGGGVVMDPA